MLKFKHLKYAKQVLKGKVVACEQVKQACQRALDDHSTEPSIEFPYQFYGEFVEPVIKFSEFVPHIKGEWARQDTGFNLEPWQRFVIGEIYGWRHKDDPYKRRYTEALLEVGRKNGKTSLMAVIGLYELLYGDEGAEVVSAATKQDQAKIVWDLSGKMLEKMPMDITQNIRKVHSEITLGNASFKALSRESKSLDGLNVSLAIIDEAAQILDRYIIEVLDTSMGSRLSPLMIFITTGGTVTTTYYFEKRALLMSVLAKQSEVNHLFGMIYKLDDKVEIDDRDCWVKANPNLGVSIYEDFLEKQVRDSAMVPSKRAQVLVKHFNIWQSSSEIWLGSDDWNKAAQITEQREGPCYLGNDLGMTRDLCYTVRLWQYSRRLFFADFKGFMPEQSMDTLPSSYKPIFEQAVNSGSLILTPGQITDYVQIEDYIRQTCEEHDVRRIGFDPYNAVQIANALEDDRLPVMLVGQSMAKMSAPSKITEQLILEGRISHKPEPFVTWQFENCHAYVDINKNIKIRKGDDPHAKIDGVIALIIAVACADVGTEPEEELLAKFIPFDAVAA